MRSRILLLFLVVTFPFIQAFAGSRLDIAFSTSDCINCSSALGNLSMLDSTIEVRLVLSENEKTFFDEFSKTLPKNPKGRPLPAIYSDSLFRQLQTLQPLSTCHFDVDSSPVFVFPLKEFYQYVKEMNQMAATFLQQTRLGSIDSLILSNRISFSIQNERICIYDYLLNKVAISKVPKYTSGHPSFLVLTSKLYTSADFLHCAGLDEKPYHGCENLLRSLSKDKPRIESVFIRHDTTYLFLTFTYPLIKGKDTLLRNNYFLGRLTSENKCSLFFIDEESTKNIHEYQLDNSAPFFITNDGMIHLPIFKETPHFPILLYTSWKIKDHYLKFVRADPQEVPNFGNQKIYAEGEWRINRGIGFFSLIPFILIPTQNLIEDLREPVSKSEKKDLFAQDENNPLFVLHDVTLQNHCYRLLYSIKDTLKVGFIQRNNKRMLLTRTLSTRNSFYTASFLFESGIGILALDQEQKQIIHLH